MLWATARPARTARFASTGQASASGKASAGAGAGGSARPWVNLRPMVPMARIGEGRAGDMKVVLPAPERDPQKRRRGSKTWLFARRPHGSVIGPQVGRTHATTLNEQAVRIRPLRPDRLFHRWSNPQEENRPRPLQKELRMSLLAAQIAMTLTLIHPLRNCGDMAWIGNLFWPVAGHGSSMSAVTGSPRNRAYGDEKALAARTRSSWLALLHA